MKTLIKKIALADKDYGMIMDNDVIAVGLSGGKDSTLLLFALEHYRIKSRKNFKILGIHLNLGFKGEDYLPVKNFFDDFNIENHIFETQVAEILELNKKDDKIQCSLCSKFKKGIVIQKAVELGCNKVAFAHHADDAIETLFLNAIYGGKLSTFDPEMYMSESKINFIRPFVYVKESEIIANAEINNLPIKKSGCPNDGYTRRQEMKNLLNQLYIDYPTAHDNFIKMLHNSDQTKLWTKVLTNI
jgi:tRNA 2-thiocytidine biosynthesis protein TtcA